MKNKKIQITIAFILGFILIFSYLRRNRLDTEVKKTSYALGRQFGLNLKKQNIEYDPEIAALALREVLEGKDSRLTVEEIRVAMTNMQQGLVKKQGDSLEKSKREANEFLEKNKTKSDVLVTSSGLQYIILKEGSGKKINGNDVVKAHYEGSVSTGGKFDSTYDRDQPAEFRVNSLVRGWSEGIQLIKRGGKIKLFIPPELGYGSRAVPGIPANSVLIVEIEVM